MFNSSFWLNQYRIVNLAKAGCLLYQCYENPFEVPYEYYPLGLLSAYEGLFPNQGNIAATSFQLPCTIYSAFNWLIDISSAPANIKTYNVVIHTLNLFHRDRELAKDIKKYEEEFLPPYLPSQSTLQAPPATDLDSKTAQNETKLKLN